MNRLRAGVVGCGRISVMYRQAFQALADQVEVVCVCDKVLERAQEFSSNFPGCKATTSFDELLDSGIDVLHILTPHFLHGEMAIQAMKKGINVLTEKPMDISMKKTYEMIKVSKETGAALGVIFQTRYMKAAQEMKKVVEQGLLGKVLGAWSTMHWSRPASYYQCDWKGLWDKEGGGVLIDQAIHSIDLVQWITGRLPWILEFSP
jgi:UDP-N-acetyl-2-amino-2-deoxyglucuronate dehydrogenase